METTTTVIAALLMATGIAGLIVPVLPGLACVVGGVLVWALGHNSTPAWIVFGVAAAVAAIGYVIQYTVPGRRMARSGIPGTSSLAGVVLGIVGFFVVPVIGLLGGFVLGVFLAEYARLREPRAAWVGTKIASKAALMTIWIELTSALIITIGWAVVVVTDVA